MAAPQVTRLYTVEEYLALEEVSEVKHEFHYGEIFAMTGATLRHNRLVKNGFRSLDKRLGNGACEVFLDGAHLVISDTHFLYPDLLVTCSPEDREAERILRHPAVIIEILSPSSLDYDRRTKLKLYQRLSSLRHYVLIAQDYCWVECLTREPSVEVPSEDKWTLQAFDLLTDILPLPAIGIEVPLAELYADIQIEQGPYLRKESK